MSIRRVNHTNHPDTQLQDRLEWPLPIIFTKQHLQIRTKELHNHVGISIRTSKLVDLGDSNTMPAIVNHCCLRTNIAVNTSTSYSSCGASPWSDSIFTACRIGSSVSSSVRTPARQLSHFITLPRYTSLNEPAPILSTSLYPSTSLPVSHCAAGTYVSID